MRRKDTHVHVIAVLVLILIFGLWFCVGFLDWAENAVMMIVGASISGFTLIVQYYFRKKPPAGDNTKPPSTP